MWSQLALTTLIGLTITNVKYIRADVHKRYDNYHVFQLSPNTTAHLDTINYLDGFSDELILLDPVHRVDIKTHALVAPKLLADFSAILRQAAIPYKLVDENAQRSLNAKEFVEICKRGVGGEYNWTNYHDLDDTYNWMYELTLKYPKQVSLFVAGQSYEGRELLGVRISCDNDEANSGSNKRRSIFIESGIHAREWIAPATATFIINQLLTINEPRVRKLAENFIWYIVPHTNPDGFVHSHTTDRLWRKTRKPYGECVGADLNRNWGFHWNEGGASNDTCAGEYTGPHAFSEIETRTFAEYLLTLKDDLLLYLTLHSYGQILVFPYGYTEKLPSNYDNLQHIADFSAAAVAKSYGSIYTGGRSYTTMYPNSGSSLDWVYGALQVPYAYSFELRPSSPTEHEDWTGFILSADQIIPTGEEIMNGLMAMVEEIDAVENV